MHSKMYTYQMMGIRLQLYKIIIAPRCAMLFIIIRRSHSHNKGGICLNVGDIFSDFNLFVVMVAADERQKKGV